MKNEKQEQESKYNFKGLFKYISTVVSWTIFILLVIIGVLLIYYFIATKLYMKKGAKYEPAFSVYTIVSQSMEPTIKVYDVIVNTKMKSADDVKINDIITYISTWDVNYGMTVTHRVVGKKTLDDGNTCFVTRGDNNTIEDKVCVRESSVVGVVKAVIPQLGRIQAFLGSSLGWLLLIVTPALYIIIKDIFKIFRLSKEIDKDKNSSSSNNTNNLKNKKNTNKKLNKAYDDLVKIKSKK